MIRDRRRALALLGMLALMSLSGCANRAEKIVETGQAYNYGLPAAGAPADPSGVPAESTPGAPGVGGESLSNTVGAATAPAAGSSAASPPPSRAVGQSASGVPSASGSGSGAGVSSAARGAASPDGTADPARTPGVPGAGPSAAISVPGPSGEAKYDQGANDREIVFGSISGLTGVLDTMRPEAARAYFKYVNDRGGVNGRKLSLRIYDDQWDVTRNAALHRQAFEQDKVFAFVSNLAPITTHGGVPFVEAKRIPVIGGEGVDLRAWSVSPYYFTTTELENVYGGQLGGRLAGEQGCKRVAGQSYNIDESRSWLDTFRKGLQERGVGDFVYRGENGLAETDFTAYAIQIKQANADCVTVGEFDAQVVRFKQALKQVGHEARFIIPSTFYSALLLKDGLFEGDLGIVPTDIVENAPNNPAMQEFTNVVNKYEPAIKDKINGWAVKAYSSAQLAVEAVRRAGNILTRDRVLEVLNQMTDLDIGTVPPMTFRPGRHEGQRCAALVQIKNGKFVNLKRWYCV